ncbi:hypothetical protein Fmac_017134 [Flemingia macrophylla]|uniref:Uncharacterized protein n=1 Tax=Flemingia macrophylla TaxID=520843 RepID=A0ABD1M1Z0_9FABA
MAIVVAKHHTVIATQEGKLGYLSVDTQPIPRRVSSLRLKNVVVVANNHTAVVSDLGEVFTWGCNREGQLGYRTSNSTSNYTPHVVESLKRKTLLELYSLCGRNMVSISAGKYWTPPVKATGDFYMWDGKKGKDKPFVATRWHGVKKHWFQLLKHKALRHANGMVELEDATNGLCAKNVIGEGG